MPATIVSRSGPAPRGSRARGPGRPGGGGESPARVALVVAGVAVAAVVLILAAFWFRGRGDDGTAAAPETASAPTTAADSSTAGGSDDDPGAPGDPFPNGPTGVTDGIPVGFTRTEAGAVAAVMSWAPFYGRIEDPQVAFELIDTVWTEETRAEERRLEEPPRGRTLGDYEADGTVEFLASQTTPLAWRVEDFDEGRATLKVWDVILVAQEPVEGPEVVFRTVTWTLQWVDDVEDWQVVTTSITTGPTPALGVVDPNDVLRTTPRLDGFTYWDPAEDGAGEWPVVRVPAGVEEAPPEAGGGG